MLFVDCDNALGSARGDVDDGFALAAILRSGAPVAGIGSVSGNTTEEQAWRNNRTLAELCGFTGPLLRGHDVAPFLSSRGHTATFLALGPLTNLAATVSGGSAALVSEAVVVGGNLTSPGRWPPLFPFEFNLTRDLPSLLLVWESPLKLTFLPLDVARQMRIRPADVDGISGPLGDYLRRNSTRWFRRARMLKWSSSIPLFDLPAAIYALDPGTVAVEQRNAELHPNGWIDFRAGRRPVRMIRSIDRNRLWERFLSLVEPRPAEMPDLASGPPG